MRRTVGTYIILMLLALGVSCGTQKNAGGSAGGGNDTAAVMLPLLSPHQAGFDGTLGPSFYYTEGIKAYRIYGAPEAAVERFDKAIALDPAHAPSYYQAAFALAAKDPDKALVYSEKAVGLDSDNVWYKSQFARLLITTHQYARAQKIYEELIKIDPKNPENYSMLASLYQFAGQPLTAIAMLEKAETVIGKMEGLTEQKRDLLVGMKLFDRAVDESKELINLYPYNFEGYLSLAEIYTQTRQDSLALQNYNMALSLNPNSTDVLMSMNEFFRFTGNNVKYLETARQMMRSDDITLEAKKRLFKDITANSKFYGDYYPQIRELGAILYQKYPSDYEVLDLYTGTMTAGGGLEEALVLYKNHISDTLTSPHVFNEILTIEAYLKRPDSLEKYTDMGLRLFPDDPMLYIRKGGALEFYLDRRDEAEKAYRKALKYAGGDSLRSVIHGYIGDLFQRDGKNEKSFKEYGQSLKLWPDNTMVLNNYAYFLSEVDMELDKALEMSDRVINKLSPGVATYIDTYAWILYKLKRYDEAKKYMQQAIALDPKNNKELYLHYGDILYAMGDAYMATVYWNRALEAGYDEAEIKARIKLTENK